MSRAAKNREELGAIRRYAESHWGLTGDEAIAKLLAGDPRKVSTALGYLHSVVYVTAKGDQEICEWEHDFSPKRPPILSYTETGKLLILGGGYRVTKRGIVG